MIPPEIVKALKSSCEMAKVYARSIDVAPLQEHIHRQAGIALAYIDTLPAAPAPDWSSAPEWAQWWAVDADGAPYWFECKPISGDAKWVQIHQQWARDKRLYVDLPLGIDWRETLVARPTETP